MLSVQIPEGESKESASKALAGFHMQDGDQVLVSPILPYNEKTVYLEGHLFRPGKYPYPRWHDGQRSAALLPGCDAGAGRSR